MTPATMKSTHLTPPQREALQRLVDGKELRGYVHGVVINHLRSKKLIDRDCYTITEAGRAALQP